MRDEQDLNLTIDKYADTVTRICLVYLKNSSDTEDIFQNVFLKYLRSTTLFKSEEHKKAFIIRITINECKDLLKNFFRKNTVNIEEVNQMVAPSNFDENAYVRQAVLTLPEKYRVVIFLHYFEGYSAVEIGKMLSKNINTVYTLMARGREILKESLGGDLHE